MNVPIPIPGKQPMNERPRAITLPEVKKELLALEQYYQAQGIELSPSTEEGKLFKSRTLSSEGDLVSMTTIFMLEQDSVVSAGISYNSTTERIVIGAKIIKIQDGVIYISESGEFPGVNIKKLGTIIRFDQSGNVTSCKKKALNTGRKEPEEDLTIEEAINNLYDVIDAIRHYAKQTVNLNDLK